MVQAVCQSCGYEWEPNLYGPPSLGDVWEEECPECGLRVQVASNADEREMC